MVSMPPPSAKLGKVESLNSNLNVGGKTGNFGEIKRKSAPRWGGNLWEKENLWEKRRPLFSGTARGLWGVGVCCSVHGEKQKN